MEQIRQMIIKIVDMRELNLLNLPDLRRWKTPQLVEDPYLDQDIPLVEQFLMGEYLQWELRMIKYILVKLAKGPIIYPYVWRKIDLVEYIFLLETFFSTSTQELENLHRSNAWRWPENWFWILPITHMIS